MKLKFPKQVRINKFPNAAGYIEVKTIEHPICGSIRTYLHRLILIEELGRPLTRREQVHHLNGDPADNRRENLLYCRTQKEHLEHHPRPCPPERAAKISASKKGKPQPWAREIAMRMRGKKRSQEFKEKVSLGMKEYCAGLPPGEMARRAMNKKSKGRSEK